MGWKKHSTTSERLKIAMELSNMKQSDLARATGLSKGGISNYVLGRYEPKSDIINLLAIALNVNEMWLWGYDAPMERGTNSIEATDNEKKAACSKPPLSPEQQILINVVSDLSPDDLIKTLEYVEFLKSKRNS